MRSALVTGSRGFIGRHFVRHLSQNGWRVTGVDIKPAPSSTCADEVEMDAREYLGRTRTRHDLVVHCAAVVGGRVNIEQNPVAVATDLAIDSDLFQWASRQAIIRDTPPQVVYFSSSAAYPVELQTGDWPWRLAEEDIDLGAVKQPDHIYGWVKLTGEQVARHVASQHGVPILVLRPFSGYGSDQDMDYPFPAIVRRVLTDGGWVTVWGDGQQTRDFIHVDDVVDATMTALDAQWFDRPLNLCTGVPTTMDELARTVARVAGQDIEQIEHLTDAPVGVRYRVGDPTTLHSMYTPKISLEQGVRRAIQSHATPS